MREFLDQEQSGQLDQLNGVIVDLESTHRGAPARAMVMNDASVPVDPHVFIRGNPGRQGAAVPRRFLRVLAEPDRRAFQKGSGRLELARAIADPKNPLTARVLVNRAWLWHFGKGLVSTPSDFGLRSDPPSHPELLDYLASEFIASGWSLKSLHRLIMLSNTYRQRSEPLAQGLTADPENRLLWRFNRQRLDFESMRDSLLAVSGVLDPAVGGPPALISEAPFSRRRTIYGYIDRQNLDGLYRTFDFAVPGRDQPAAICDDGAATGVLPDEQPVPARAGAPADLLDRARAEGARLRRDRDRRATRPTGFASYIAASWDGRPGPTRSGSQSSSFAANLRYHRQNTAPGAAHPDTKADQPLSPWEQLSQVLLLTNEFMFVD